MEEKRIPGFEDYSITSEGTVYSYKWGRRIEKAQILNHGHVVVFFTKNGYPYQRSVALLVARAFIPKPEISRMVRHKDGNKWNNSADNLEWIICEDRVLGYI